MSGVRGWGHYLVRTGRDWSSRTRPSHSVSCLDMQYQSSPWLSHSSRDDYRGALSAEEMAALEEGARLKDLCLQAIAAREAQIRAIRDGQLTACSTVSCLT